MALRFWFTLSVWKNFVLLFFKSLDEARNWHNTPSNSKSQWCTFKLSAAEADINTWKMTLLQSKSSLGCMFVQKKSVCFYLSIPISPSLSPCFFPFSSHLFSLRDPLLFFFLDTFTVIYQLFPSSMDNSPWRLVGTFLCFFQNVLQHGFHEHEHGWWNFHVSLLRKSSMINEKYIHKQPMRTLGLFFCRTLSHAPCSDLRYHQWASSSFPRLVDISYWSKKSHKHKVVV